MCEGAAAWFISCACFLYGSETIIWREKKKRSRIRAVQMDNLRGLLGIRRMDKVLNAWSRELCRVMR